MTEDAWSGMGASGSRQMGYRWVRRSLQVAVVTLGTLTAGSCSLSSVGLPSAQVVLAEPLSEEDIRIVTEVIDLADRRDFDFAIFADAASAEDARVRRQTANAVGRTGRPEARQIARHLLDDPDSTVASTAAFALGLLADSASVPTLADKLLARDSLFRASVAIEAASALGRIATAESAAVLQSFLEGVGIDVAPSALDGVAAALLAASAAGLDEVALYARWMDSPLPATRRAAAYGLIRCEHPDAVPHLRAMLGDSVAEIRALAVSGLPRALQDAGEVLTGEIVQALLPLRNDSVYAVRIGAIRTLATIGSGSALEAVVQAARTDSDHERTAALEALGSVGDTYAEASRLLEQTALDSGAHPHHRGVAAAALATVAPASSNETLFTLVKDSSWRVRAAAGSALASLPTVDYAALVPVATDPDPRVAAATVRALSEREDTASLRSVRTLLIEALGRNDVQLRAVALAAGAKIAEPSLFSLFLDAYAHAQADSIPDAQLAAIDAIAALADHGIPFPARAFFARFPESSNYRVRERVLAQFGQNVRNAWRPPFPLSSGTGRQRIEAAVRQWIAPADPDAARPHIIIETERGDIGLELLPEEAPITVGNFLELVRSGFFDGQEWPRIVPGFVVQGGDRRGDTSGGVGYAIRDELNRLRFEAGTLGMALAGPDTGGNQFFITHSPQPHLDGTYTAFGRLLFGGTVMEELMVGDRIVRIVEIPRIVVE